PPGQAGWPVALIRAGRSLPVAYGKDRIKTKRPALMRDVTVCRHPVAGSVVPVTGGVVVLTGPATAR
ncbi:hypothetical protein LH462_00740, partial [Laribacter hongkongensis]|uniref:hypothetical protein n=1 Tax=Laribacter hongkongensis TaxID=168471 RepID=UPI001EFCA70E